MSETQKIFIATRIILTVLILLIFAIFLSYLVKQLPSTAEGKLISTAIFIILPFATFQGVRNADVNLIYKPFKLSTQKIGLKTWLILSALVLVGFIGNLLILYMIAPIISFAYYSYSDYKNNFIRKI